MSDRSILYSPSRWAQQPDLLKRHELSALEAVDRCRRLREKLLTEFTAEQICSWGLDNPFASLEAHALMVSSARTETNNRRHHQRLRSYGKGVSRATTHVRAERIAA